MIRKIINLILILGLLFQQTGFSYAAGELNIANYLSQARSAIVTPDQFRPPQLRFISYDTKSNDFKLFLDSPAPELLNSQNPLNSPTPKLNDSTQELFNYFLTGLALPNDTFWVNLRPDAPDNIIDPLLEKTEIGKIFLEADLQLKKDTASYTSPQNPQGRQYWDKLYKKAGELFGSENITIPTITRPWIVPNEVIVRETEDSAYIYKATLKVMLEEDYLKNYQQSNPNHQPLTSNYSFSGPRMKELNQYSTQLIKETIIPQLTKEVNSSKRYAKLRQVYYSLVLSRWFKQKYSRGSAVSGPQSAGQDTSYVKLINSRDLTNLASHEPCDKQAYFQAYQKSFKDGEYNLQETLPTPIGQSIRSYVSGGIVASPITFAGINAEENIGVTKALTGQPPATTASPLDIDEIVKNIGDMFTGRGLRTANLLGVKYPEKLSEEIKVLIKDYYANPDDAVKFSKASKALREVVKVEGYDQESKEIIEKGITWSIIATGELVNYYQKSIPLGLELISKLEGTLDKKIIFTTQKGREAYKDEFGNAQRELKKYVAVEKAGGFLEEIMDRGEDIYILKYKFMEAEAKFSAGSPLNGEALEVELVKLPKTEKLLSDLIKIFSKVDKSAQLGPQIAILIAEMLTESGVTPFPGESPNVYLMRGAVMKSVTTFFLAKNYTIYIPRIDFL